MQKSKWYERCLGKWQVKMAGKYCTCFKCLDIFALLSFIIKCAVFFAFVSVSTAKLCLINEAFVYMFCCTQVENAFRINEKCNHLFINTEQNAGVRPTNSWNCSGLFHFNGSLAAACQSGDHDFMSPPAGKCEWGSVKWVASNCLFERSIVEDCKSTVAAPTKYIARSFQGQINIEPGQSSTLAANELAPLTGRKATLSKWCISPCCPQRSASAMERGDSKSEPIVQEKSSNQWRSQA